ncbi:MAG: hypothetical protein JOY54_07555 [Acidobacteriaceae bacterium]|nr:hypothetical protein [Acidobacteriaceae bacterium]
MGSNIACSNGLCARRLALIPFLLAVSVANPQTVPGLLSPAQSVGKKPEQAPGQVAPGQNADIPQAVAPQSPSPVPQSVPQAQSGAPPVPVTFESHGLEYDVLTSNGVTVMFATLPPRIKNFNVVQITVTNGSLVSWTVRPTDLKFIRDDGTVLPPASADDVVETLLDSADRNAVIRLELLYENSIYALSNFRSTNGYEQRREAAMAQFVNRGLKAAAEASAIAFVPTKLKPGDSTDGAIFFENRTKEKGLGAGRLIAHFCGETFMFETYAEYKKH